MTNRKLLSATALQTTALVFFASATPSFAQTAVATTGAASAATAQAQPATDETTNSTQPAQVIAATQANEPAATKSEAAITITGSRIKRPNLESALPVTSIQGEQISNAATPTLVRL